MAQKGAQRQRTDSIDREIAINQNVASEPLEPPEGITLSPDGMRFWLAILDARARDDWPVCDLPVAAALAQTQADVVSEQKLLDAEGTVIGDKVNPRFVVVEALHRRVGSLMRLLRMGGYVAGNSYDDANRRSKERRIEKVAKELQADTKKTGTGANIYRLLA